MNKNKTMPYKIGAGEIDRLKMRCSAAVSIEANRTKDGAKIWRWGVTMAAVAIASLMRVAISTFSPMRPVRMPSIHFVISFI